MITQNLQDTYLRMLKEELVPATGCTEPGALAYAAAKLRELLNAAPARVRVEVSGNILKNVNSVTIPNTGGLTGVRAAVAAGIVAGRAECGLEVIAAVSSNERAQIAAYANASPIEVACLDTPRKLDIRISGWSAAGSAAVHIANSHSNIVYMEKDGKTLLEKAFADSPEDGLADKRTLCLQSILDFADEVDTALPAALLDRQIEYNSAIAEEGLRGAWGARIGALRQKEGGIAAEASAYAAAGSDARMSGCVLPVVILSGSGNQGITATLPVVRYAAHLGVSREKLYRALLVSDLVTLYQKAGIGRLSAYCGAVSAGVGAGAAIAYLHDEGRAVIAGTISNALAILSGTVCDGAKPSCAAKIAASVDAGILGWQMARSGNNFRSGDGLVGADADGTVHNIGILASQGMRATDRTILKIMTQEL